MNKPEEEVAALGLWSRPSNYSHISYTGKPKKKRASNKRAKASRKRNRGNR